jgi:hypothetical protein
MMEVNWDGYLEWSDSSNITAQLPAYNNFNWLPLGDFVLGNFFFLTCPHKRERKIRNSNLRFIIRVLGIEQLGTLKNMYSRISQN